MGVSYTVWTPKLKVFLKASKAVGFSGKSMPVFYSFEFEPEFSACIKRDEFKVFLWLWTKGDYPRKLPCY